MDEEPREADASVEPGERSPEELQAEIEATRRALGDTVAAVAEKADVKRQAREQIDGVKHAIHSKREQLIGTAGTGSSGTAGDGVQQVMAIAREQPVPLAVGGALVLGFLVGRRRSR